MAFDKARKAEPNYDGDTNAPVSTVGQWRNVLSGILGVNDNGGARILIVDTQVAKPGHRELDLELKATIVRFRLAYDVATTTIAKQLKVMAFGQTKTDGWQLLKALDGEEEVIITAFPALDIRDANFKYTTPDRFVHAWDADGCARVAFGIVTEHDGNGDETLAFGQAKAIN